MRTRGRIEDAIIELDIVNEAELPEVHRDRPQHPLRLRPRSSRRRSFEPRVLAKVSAITATLHGVFPVLLDDRNTTLSVRDGGSRQRRRAARDPASPRACGTYAPSSPGRRRSARPSRTTTGATRPSFSSLLRPVNSFDEILYTNSNNPVRARVDDARARIDHVHERASMTRTSGGGPAAGARANDARAAGARGAHAGGADAHCRRCTCSRRTRRPRRRRRCPRRSSRRRRCPR